MTDKQMIHYEELYTILHRKFRATHEEVQYWVRTSKMSWKNHQLHPYRCDLPFFEGVYPPPHEGILYPEYCFYRREEVEDFFPFPAYRFVYLKDLTAIRNWYDFKTDEHNSKIFSILKRANEIGVLRLYDPDTQDFTLWRTKNKSSSIDANDKKQMWCHTFEGENYFSNPDSFFLLYDILNIERVFFQKDINVCLNELLMAPVNLDNATFTKEKNDGTQKETN